MMPIFCALCLCACGSNTPKTLPAQIANETPATTAPQDLSGLPPVEEEEAIYKHVTEKADENAKRKYHDEQQKEKLESDVQRLQNSGDHQGHVRALMALAKFHKVRRSNRECEVALQRAVEVCAELPKDAKIRGHAYLDLGDAYLRNRKYDEALEMFQRAQTRLSAQELGHENAAQVLERIAWAYRSQKNMKTAQKTAEKALKLANQTYGKNSAVYRVAMIELAVLAMDRGDRAETDRIVAELDGLQTQTETPFARQFIRTCARQCRRDEQSAQEDFLEAQSKVFPKTH